MEGKWAHEEEEVRTSDVQGQAHRAGGLGHRSAWKTAPEHCGDPGGAAPRDRCQVPQRACDTGEAPGEMGSREGKFLLPQKQGAERARVGPFPTEELRAGCACSSPSLGNTLEFNPNNRDFTGISFEEPERAVSGGVRGGHCCPSRAGQNHTGVSRRQGASGQCDPGDLTVQTRATAVRRGPPSAWSGRQHRPRFQLDTRRDPRTLPEDAHSRGSSEKSQVWSVKGEGGEAGQQDSQRAVGRAGRPRWWPAALSCPPWPPGVPAPSLQRTALFPDPHLQPVRPLPEPSSVHRVPNAFKLPPYLRSLVSLTRARLSTCNSSP